jgi:hypothetical protein
MVVGSSSMKAYGNILSSLTAYASGFNVTVMFVKPSRENQLPAISYGLGYLILCHC